jgi:hypothetical protein
MTERRYALERGGPKDLRIRWRRGFADLEVALGDGAWRLDRAAVDAGASVVLPGGSTLLVHRVRRRWWSVALRDDLRVERDGVPVPASDGDPRTIGRRAARLILLLALMRVGFVGLWFVFSRTGPEWAGMNVAGAMFLGAGAALVLLAVLAWLGKRLAVALAAGLFSLELAASYAFLGGRPGIGTLILVLVIVHLVQAWQRMRPRAAQPNLASVFE